MRACCAVRSCVEYSHLHSTPYIWAEIREHSYRSSASEDEPTNDYDDVARDRALLQEPPGAKVYATPLTHKTTQTPDLR